MCILFGFLFHHSHSALVTSVGSWTFVLLMLHDFDTHDLLSTVDARHKDIWANGLMFFNIFSHALDFALLVGCAFHQGKLTLGIVSLHFLVR
jgi:hypothetical protein